MADLTTTYLGLSLHNPIIVGSSGLTNNIESIKKIAKNKAGAIVLKSIFEEQITMEANKAVENDASLSTYPEAADYISNYTKQENVGQYLKLIEDAKKAVHIPVIASVNCVSSTEWTSFAKKIEAAGADALELNAFVLPSDEKNDSEKNEKFYFDLTEKVRKEISIPIALKMSYYSAGLAQLIQKLSWSGNINGLVLFNRFFSPDIDIDKMQVVANNIFSTPEEISTSLRWIALMSPKIKTDLSASTGIHSGEGIIKQILAGAKTVQLATAVYQNGPEIIPDMLKELEKWMDDNKYAKLDDFRGKMNQENTANPAAYERIQFMKYFAGIE
ncbi:MAG: diguanylate cyclase [Marinilabiliales bacterium]|nr:MAG: diguanylate cyclase [Marinilabiliales bacterium]